MVNDVEILLKALEFGTKEENVGFETIADRLITHFTAPKEVVAPGYSRLPKLGDDRLITAIREGLEEGKIKDSSEVLAIIEKALADAKKKKGGDLFLRNDAFDVFTDRELNTHIRHALTDAEIPQADQAARAIFAKIREARLAVYKRPG